MRLETHGNNERLVGAGQARSSLPGTLSKLSSTHMLGGFNDLALNEARDLGDSKRFEFTIT